MLLSLAETISNKKPSVSCLPHNTTASTQQTGLQPCHDEEQHELKQPEDYENDAALRFSCSFASFSRS